MTPRFRRAALALLGLAVMALAVAPIIAHAAPPPRDSITLGSASTFPHKLPMAPVVDACTTSSGERGFTITLGRDTLCVAQQQAALIWNGRYIMPLRFADTVTTADTADAHYAFRDAEMGTFVVGNAFNVANRMYGLDVDSGGYKDSWRTSDKLVHASIAFGLTSACTSAGGRPWVCAPIVAAVGYGFELSQGTVSQRDAYADAAGAVLSAAVTTIARHFIRGG